MKLIFKILFVFLIIQAFPLKAEVLDDLHGSNDYWWSRIRVNPVDTKIKDIDIKLLNPQWKTASIFELESIVKKFPKENVKKDFADNSASLEINGDFNNDSYSDIALLGVYRSVDKKEGTFFLILTKKGSKWEKSFLYTWPQENSFSKENFLALKYEKPNIKIMNCFECCGYKGDLIWSKSDQKYKFYEEKTD